MTDQVLHLHIDLAGIAGRVQRLLKDATYLVAIGSHASSNITVQSLELPDIPFVHSFKDNNPWSVEQAQSAWNHWILTNGFREIAEVIAGTLEEVRTVLAMWELASPTGEAAKVKAEDWNRNIGRGTDQFHRRTLPQKLAYLASAHGFRIQNDHVAEIKSINAARNCLVHRAGTVGQMDVDDSGALVLRWRHLKTVIIEDGTERDLVLPFVAEKDTELGIKLSMRERSFQIGQRFEVDLQTFSELCWTLFVFAQRCAADLEAYAKEKGFIMAARAA